jgi:hypothetical protein
MIQKKIMIVCKDKLASIMDRIKDRFIKEYLKIINGSNKNIVFYYNDVIWKRKRIWISPLVMVSV